MFDKFLQEIPDKNTDVSIGRWKDGTLIVCTYGKPIHGITIYPNGTFLVKEKDEGEI